VQSHAEGERVQNLVRGFLERKIELKRKESILRQNMTVVAVAHHRLLE
jgi:hypothetical protein